jgi:FkbM family methyltransferase
VRWALDRVGRFGRAHPNTELEASPAMTLPALVHALLREIVAADAGPELVDNVDATRFPDGVEEPPAEGAPARLAAVLNAAAGLGLLFERLEQPSDRELLVRLLAFRVLGHRRVQLPMTADRRRRLIARVEASRTAERTAPIGIFDWYADDFDLTRLGYPIRVRSRLGGVIQTFELEQYRCPGSPEVAARPGDVVIDGGGYWGETALYFAHLAGEGGLVVSFEFEPSNLAAVDRNLGLNPELARRIRVMPSALWSEAGNEVAFRSFGPGTAIVADGEASASTDTIDALVARGEVERVDFIKFDIEGAELEALRGAEATLRRFRPRLAIASYHKPDDLVSIPAYLAGLDVGYRFRLGHTTMHAEETVLFATVEE